MKATVEDKIIDFADDDTAIDLLTELVRIPSHSEHESTAVEFLVSRMSQLGLTAFCDEAGNAVGVVEYPDERGELSETGVLLGHIDTVPGAISVRVENGVLFGRGSVDAKGSLATMVMAVARASRIPGRRLIVVGAVEEETVTSKGARFIAQQYRPDWCIIGEPSGAEAVTLGYKGRLQLKARLTQPVAHSAGPQSAVAEYAVNWWNALKSWGDAFNRERQLVFEQLQISLNEFNTESDGLEEKAQLRVGLRLPVRFPVEEFKAFANGELTRVCSEISTPATIDGLRCDSAGHETEVRGTLETYGEEVAHQEPRTSRIVTRFNQAFRSLGIKPKHKLKTGTSDMNVVSPIWKCPIVAYGPGDSRFDHTPDEQLPLNEYLSAIRVLTTVLGA
ncbi:MAG TPA: M20/M25/M40 family metallo-hydrolase [Pirellulaceae bacterium]|mgnify:CR=1 FL=1|nr:M20/M25/M40 family metallo-hydrolase [Pirellulaceae bacterium]HMO92116.1 M20/M25/M40 family metallo-hydrolase [Pirellulaceae bacterium]HMP69296.1 M20/M25/M40 family metallo-hydrolase [Pirellulaceae bacterium]